MVNIFGFSKTSLEWHEMTKPSKQPPNSDSFLFIYVFIYT